MRYRLHTEKLKIKTLMQLDLDGAAALDIGANKGIYCFWMLRAVGRSGRVVAFEPQPEMAEAIRQKQARFDWANLEIVALSDAEGEIEPRARPGRRWQCVARDLAPSRRPGQA